VKSPITTHVLDTARGVPAVGLPVALSRQVAGDWQLLGQGVTDADGRAANLLPTGHLLQAGRYRLTFGVAAYQASFFPEVVVCFEISDTSRDYHVPLLLSPFGYSTYRGS